MHSPQDSKQSAPAQWAQSGFTLIELMITVAVIAILSTIAYPSYADYMRRGQLQEAPTNLADYRTRMEQYYQDNRSYASGSNCGVTLPATPTAKYFTYTCATANSGQTYTATATGSSGAVSGFAYTIDQLNTQASSCTSCAWNFSAQNSWVLRKP
ncbi:type IV pilin protein [Variovorax sp. J22R133]|uniref:type IV pilin protein n=1 Tax=Variovorax brevis TaxID=3053503 RepID=UPI002577AB10|nr:type IV pilin protein [Variovorax sp. J22R133]MDM0115270.1 type IV pilin protein [Variovorax sp. J22R133]